MLRNYGVAPLVGYHGCEKSIAEKVLSGEQILNKSENDYDWLGPGIYFWVDSFKRAEHWAQNNKKIKEPYVLGAFILPGHCLNLTDYGITDLLKQIYVDFKQAMISNGQPLPSNTIPDSTGSSLVRRLDCAVINYLHTLKKHENEAPFDSVYGVFEEGESIYEGSGIREKTHVQLAVINHDCIIGYFRPSELCSARD